MKEDINQRMPYTELTSDHQKLGEDFLLGKPQGKDFHFPSYPLERTNLADTLISDF